MPPQLNSDQPDQTALPPSRRSVLRGAAGVGAVGLAATVGGGIFAASSASAATRPAAGKPAAATTTAEAEAPASDEALVVYLRDARSGEFEIFNGTKQVTVRNKQLVNELLHGLATAQ